LTDSSSRFSAAVLLSGNGSNLQALVDAVAENRLDVALSVVISNKAGAYGLTRAAQANIDTITVPSADFQTREDFESALAEVIDRYAPDIIVLAGFMRILTPAFVDRYAGQIINIHPSLLPKFRGLHTHQRALENGERWHGCTVHFVSEDLDGGPAIIQGKVAVLDDDTQEQLAARVLNVEHQIFPEALALIAAGRLRLKDAEIWFDSEKLEEPIQFTSLEA
jgi:phosphoribosylglycinamide formyltransferase-1